MKFLYCFLLCFFCNYTLASVSNWVDVLVDNGHIKFPVVLHGISGMAILDSGSQVNAINDGFIKKNNLKLVKGKKIKIVGVYGEEKRGTYSQIPVEMFGAKLNFDNLVSTRLGHHSNAILLGAGFMNKFIIQIDYVNKRMRFLARKSIDLRAIQNLDMINQRGSGNPIVKVRLNNEHDVWLLLDTGNSGGLMLERSVAVANGWLQKYPVTSVMSQGVISAGYNDTFNIPELSIGPIVLENAIISVPSEGQSSNLSTQYHDSFSRLKSKKVQGILGYDVLKHFILTIDYADGLGHLAIPQEE